MICNGTRPSPRLHSSDWLEENQKFLSPFDRSFLHNECRQVIVSKVTFPALVAPGQSLRLSGKPFQIQV